MRALLCLALLGCSGGPAPSAPAAPPWQRELDRLAVAHFLDGTLDTEGRLRLARLSDFEGNDGSRAVEAVRGLDGASASAYRDWRLYETGAAPRPTGVRSPGAELPEDPVALRAHWLALGPEAGAETAMRWAERYPGDASAWFALGQSAGVDPALPPEARAASAAHAFSRARARDPAVHGRAPTAVRPAELEPPCTPPPPEAPAGAHVEAVADVVTPTATWRFRVAHGGPGDALALEGRVTRAEGWTQDGRRVPGVLRGGALTFDEPLVRAMVASVERRPPGPVEFALAGAVARRIYSVYAPEPLRLESRGGAPAGDSIPPGGCGAWAWRVVFDRPPAVSADAYAPARPGPYVVEAPPLPDVGALLARGWPVARVAGPDGLTAAEAFGRAVQLGAHEILEPANWVWARRAGNRAVAMRALLSRRPRLTPELWWARPIGADDPARAVVRVGETWYDPQGDHRLAGYLPPELRGAEARSLERPDETRRLPERSPVEAEWSWTLTLRANGDAWVGEVHLSAAGVGLADLRSALDAPERALADALPGVVLTRPVERTEQGSHVRASMRVRVPMGPAVLARPLLLATAARPDPLDYIPPRAADLVTRGLRASIRARFEVPPGFHLDAAWDSFERVASGIWFAQRVGRESNGLVLEREVEVEAKRIPTAAHPELAEALRALSAQLRGRLDVRRAETE